MSKTRLTIELLDDGNLLVSSDTMQAKIVTLRAENEPKEPNRWHIIDEVAKLSEEDVQFLAKEAMKREYDRQHKQTEIYFTPDAVRNLQEWQKTALKDMPNQPEKTIYGIEQLLYEGGELNPTARIGYSPATRQMVCQFVTDRIDSYTSTRLREIADIMDGLETPANVQPLNPSLPPV